MLSQFRHLHNTRLYDLELDPIMRQIYTTFVWLLQGLFHGGVALSGTALCDQYLQTNPEDATSELATRYRISADAAVSCRLIQL